MRGQRPDEKNGRMDAEAQALTVLAGRFSGAVFSPFPPSNTACPMAAWHVPTTL